VPAEDEDSIAVYLHLCDEEVNGGLPIVSHFSLDELVREQFETAIYAAALLHKGFHRELQRLAPVGDDERSSR